MKVGALIVTTGLPRISGITALLPEVGSISAGQRMISVFQRAEVSMVGLVVGPEDKKSERQFARNGVIFLHCKDGATFLDGVREGLKFMAGKYQRIFVVPGDMPLFLPRTLHSLLQSTAPIAVPVNSYVNGYPVLLDSAAVEMILNSHAETTLEDAIRNCALPAEYIPVADSGILLHGEDMTHRAELIEKQNSQLSRPVAEVAICNGSPLYDSRLAMLLHLVEDTHSVQDACSLMQISYSTAWKMLNHVEEELGFPLILRNRGGASGCGSVLTEKGRALMTAYDRFSAHLNQEAKRLYDKIFDTTE